MALPWTTHVALKTLVLTAVIALPLGLVVGVPPAHAADTPTKASAQVKSGLYVTALEAWDVIQAHPDTLLIDTRDPVEVMFTGFADETDIHVPYMLADPTRLNTAKGGWHMVKNARFADEVEARLRELGADPQRTRLIFMCRSGSTRSAPAADLLYDRGWTRTYTMVDGFEGGKRPDGPSKGVRDVSGWRNSGLPWSYTLPEDIIYVRTD
ncbi:sulfurtransferase [Roseospira marina]|uniref:Sulfurtransferase n=1 Tax=Roseospira marina TaxID=140057 RepID=A0A5M6IFE1_9PROT|nr:sulfurtransferase [Roseospira marina]KAA5607000.1 sulfurtransferase [Roseospira marina]MBB4312818.1 rhodanese-related sulfurtransferase [Roseospira marina]MBB5086409.1 rhodanese-related sulfurtransferase [Roseospira marina]